jgi:radical SAM superfamily enzyme YgiQ (UPF0313 family)
MKWNTIAQAQRVLGREEGTIHKDWGGRLRVALAYPNTYSVGMSSLALQTIYRAFNSQPDVVCERVFWEKGHAGQPLISLEGQHAVADFDLLAFTVSFEMDYFNLVEMLRQAGMPPLARDRDETWPLVLGGGPALTMNPEPLAPFFDAIVIGEGEEVIGALIDLFQDAIASPRATLLDQLAAIPGVYVPQIHHNDPSLPNWHPIERLWIHDLTARPTVSCLYTPDTEFSDLHLIEIARGCGRGCRFCLAGYVYRPPREVPVDILLDWARAGLQGHRKLGLVSAAVSDHTEIDRLAEGLRSLGARISVSSMRTDPLSIPLVELLAASGTQTLTIAPEAGSPRLRAVINKTQNEDDILAAVDLAERLRFPQLKLYFMLGHPTETMADIQALIDLAQEVRGRFSRRLALNTTPYVPKAHTPFQWEAMTAAAVIKERQGFIQRSLPRDIEVRGDSAEWAEVQGVLARGDRRLADVLLRVERLSIASFHAALAACGLSMTEYLGARALDQHLPWQIVDSTVSLKYLQMEQRLASRDRHGRPCPPDSAGCLACGACDEPWAFRLTGGVKRQA